MKTQSDLLQGSSFGLCNSCSTTFLLYLGLTVDEKRILEEFSGPSDTQQVDVVDPSPAPLEGGVWQDLGQEGLTQGFIDDIQGLLEGK